LSAAGGWDFESITAYQHKNQNECLSIREFYKAQPSNLDASDTQVTTYTGNRDLQTAISEHLMYKSTG
jgi:hypothetical protein